MQHGIIHCNMTEYNAKRYNRIQHETTQCNKAQYNTA